MLFVESEGDPPWATHVFFQTSNCANAAANMGFVRQHDHSRAVVLRDRGVGESERAGARAGADESGDEDADGEDE